MLPKRHCTCCPTKETIRADAAAFAILFRIQPTAVSCDPWRGNATSIVKNVQERQEKRKAEVACVRVPCLECESASAACHFWAAQLPWPNSVARSKNTNMHLPCSRPSHSRPPFLQFTRTLRVGLTHSRFGRIYARNAANSRDTYKLH